ncbi:hypothetical protein C0J56_28200 [Pseudomonas fluorescens]|nr:hypothetical protein C0J56_28200 [Pseudomonas fluorescens]
MLWEQSLLAIAVGLLASMLNVPPSSRASSLPQWDRSTTGRTRPAVRPPSRASPLPQLDRSAAVRNRSATRPPRGGR